MRSALRQIVIAQLREAGDGVEEKERSPKFASHVARPGVAEIGDNAAGARQGLLQVKLQRLAHQPCGPEKGQQVLGGGNQVDVVAASWQAALDTGKPQTEELDGEGEFLDSSDEGLDPREVHGSADKGDQHALPGQQPGQVQSRNDMALRGKGN